MCKGTLNHNKKLRLNFSDQFSLRRWPKGKKFGLVAAPDM